jgi:putative nucleotidyltransferase with HDIG domain
MKNLKIKRRITTGLKETFVSITLEKKLFAVLLVFFLTLNYLLLFLSIRNQINIAVNEPAPQDIIVPATISYIDEAKTAQAIENAKKSVMPLYTYDSNVEIEVQNRIVNLFNEILSIKEDSSKTKNEKVASLKQIFDNDSELANYVLELSKDRLLFIKNFLLNEFNNLYKKGIRDSEINDAFDTINKDINSLKLSDAEKTLTLWISRKFIEPNFVYDEEATNKAIQEAIKKVKPVEVVLQEGTKIIEKGHIITKDDITMLQKIGIYKTVTIYNIILLAFLALLESVIAFIILSGKKNVPKKTSEFLLIISIFSFLSFFISSFSIYLILVALFLIVFNEFFELKDLLLSSFVFILILLPFLTQPLFVIIIFSVTSLLIVYYINKTKKIASYIISSALGGFFVGITVFFMGKTFSLATQSSFANSLFSFLNFLLSVPIAIVIIYIFEHIFNEATLLRLLELNDLNTPLLKEMSVKAPGTFAHSIAVANISSQAAEAINANSLLVRVGALYHDIGKLLYPYYFTENQSDVPNIHNTISPSLSKVIILNHVKDGIELGKRYRLPDDIIHFIETHHGKSVMMYFYLKAKEIDPNVTMDDFRYPGPLPDTKETVIVSLADAVEAASKSLDKEELEYRKIEELVNRLIEDRIKQGELSEADITFAELEKVKNSFVKSLISMYHKRERYPNGK